MQTVLDAVGRALGGLLTFVWEFSVSSLGGLLGVAVMFYNLGLLARVLDRKGRSQSPEARQWTQALVCISLWLIWGSVMAVTVPPSLPVVVYAMMFPLAAVGAGVSIGLLHLLPRRRATGPNWRLNKLAVRLALPASRAVIAASAVIGAIPLVQGLRALEFSAIKNGLLAALASVLLGLALGYLIRLGATFIPTEPRPHDPDAPSALFLRPFRAELLPFAFRRSLVEHRDLSFEAYLGPEFARRLGTIVGLGNPAVRIPAADRVHVYLGPAADWQSELRDMIRTAVCVVTAPAISEETIWEFRETLELGAAEKFFVLTPPLGQGPDYREPMAWRNWRAAQWRDAQWRNEHWREAGREWVHRMVRSLYAGRIRNTSIARSVSSQTYGTAWAETSAALSRSGYTMCPDPGPGAVVGFSRTGVAGVLTRDAAAPEAYVEVIAARLAG